MTDIERRIEAVPVKHRSMYRKALAGELSPRAAIKVKCYDCVGWERWARTLDGQRIDNIGDCSVRGCPLWAVRPFRMARQSSQGLEAGTSVTELAGVEGGDGPGL